MNIPEISIVIPTYNGKLRIGRLLDSISHQSMAASRFEVIVIDDGSTDGTPDELKKLQLPFLLRVISIKSSGPPHARNVGIGEAKGEIVGLFDDDIMCRNDCFENAVSIFRDKDIAVVETTLFLEGTDKPLLRGSVEQGFITASIFFRREILRAVGGMDEEFWDGDLKMFFRDDSDLGFRVIEAGYNTIRSHEVVAWHPQNFYSLQSSFAHVRRYMFDALLYRKHPRLYRKYIERKKVGPVRFGRPMHYASVMYIAAWVLALGSLIFGNLQGIMVASLAIVSAYSIVRYKFHGGNARRAWNLKEDLAFAALPFVYFYWLVKGCRRFGGWGVML